MLTPPGPVMDTLSVIRLTALLLEPCGSPRQTSHYTAPTVCISTKRRSVCAHAEPQPCDVRRTVTRQQRSAQSNGRHHFPWRSSEHVTPNEVHDELASQGNHFRGDVATSSHSGTGRNFTNPGSHPWNGPCFGGHQLFRRYSSRFGPVEWHDHKIYRTVARFRTDHAVSACGRNDSDCLSTIGRGAKRNPNCGGRKAYVSVDRSRWYHTR
jgi:hypothetical protein